MELSISTNTSEINLTSFVQYIHALCSSVTFLILDLRRTLRLRLSLRILVNMSPEL